MILLGILTVLVLLLILNAVGTASRKLEEIKDLVARMPATAPAPARTVLRESVSRRRRTPEPSRPVDTPAGPIETPAAPPPAAVEPAAEPAVPAPAGPNHETVAAPPAVESPPPARPPAPADAPAPAPALPPPLPEWAHGAASRTLRDSIPVHASESGSRNPAVRPPDSLEARIGQRWLVRIGGLILLAGMGFLYHWSVEQELVSDAARALSGTAAGIALWVLGALFDRRGYAALSQGFIGAGSALLQLTLFAACQVFDLVEPPLAFAGMIAVTAATVGFALRQRALSLALLAQIGGLLTPVLLGGSDDVRVLLGYLCILDAGFLAVAALRNWRWLDLVGFAGTAILAGLAAIGVVVARSAGLPASSLPEVAAWITALAGLHLLGWTAKPLLKREFAPAHARWLLPAGLAGFAALSTVLLCDGHRTGLGLLFAGAAAVLLALARAFDRRVPGETVVRGILDAAAAAFLLAAVPGVFREQVVTHGWAVSGVALLFVAPRLRSSWLRLGGIAGLGLAFARAVTVQMHWGPLPDGFRAFLNADFAASAGVALAFGAAAVADREGRRAFAALGGLALLAFVAREWEVLVRAAGGGAGDIAASVLLSRYLTATFGFLGFALFSERGRRPAAAGIASALALAGGAAFLLLLRHVQVPEALFLVNGRSLAMLALPAALLGIAAAWRSAPARSLGGVMARVHAVAGLAQPFLLLSFEAWRFFSRVGESGAGGFMGGQAALSVAWTAYAAVLLAVGIAKRVAPLRLAALGLLSVVLAKVVFFDLSELDQFYRIVSFIALGLVLMAGAWIYHRFARRLFPETSVRCQARN